MSQCHVKYGADAKIQRYQDYGEDGYESIGVYEARDETDEEMNKRLELDAHWRKQREDRERKEFERLRAKVDG
jgi:hypothetical protein